jgi:hypothetical protein
MRDYRPLPPQTLSGQIHVCRPDPPKTVTLDSDALEVMTDLKQIYAAVIETQIGMDAAKQYMIQRGVRLLFALNHDRSLAGLVTANDIQGEKPMRLVQERGTKHDEIRVMDIMTPLDRLEAMPMEEVRHSKVGHILASLKGAGRQHALVTEMEGSRTMVRGLFSLSQIARQLGISVQTSEIAKSFAEIEVMLAANSALA